MDEPAAAPAASTSEETPAAAPAGSGTPHSPPAGTAELAPDAAADSDSGMGIPNGDGADEHKDDVGVDVLGSPEGGYSTENLNLPEGFKLDGSWTERSLQRAQSFAKNVFNDCGAHVSAP